MVPDYLRLALVAAVLLIAGPVIAVAAVLAWDAAALWRVPLGIALAGAGILIGRGALAEAAEEDRRAARRRRR